MSKALASGPTAVDGKSSFRKSSITTDWEKNGGKRDQPEKESNNGEHG